MLVLKTPPTIEPVTTMQLAAFLRLDVGDDDMLLTYLTAARQQIENYLRRSLMTQTWTYTIDAKNIAYSINLPRPPLQTVTSITSYSFDDAAHVELSTKYVVDVMHEPGRVFLKAGQIWGPNGWRDNESMLFEYVAGYGDTPDKVPMQLRAAILETAAHWVSGGALGNLPSATLKVLNPLVVPVL